MKDLLSPGIRYMLISTLAFSLMQVGVKMLPHLPAAELILFRSLVSIILSFGYLKLKKISVLGNNKPVLFLRGLFGIIALSLFFITLQEIPLASAVTLAHLSPIFTSIFAVFILKEKVKGWQWIFFGISFGGVAMIKGFDERLPLIYLIAGIGSAIFAGLAYNMVRKLRSTDHPVVVVMYFPMVAIPVMSVVSAFQWVTPVGIDWLIILGIGIFTQIGQVFMTMALQKEVANKVSAMKYLGILYALLWGFFFFGEIFSIWTIAGMLLVILGVILNVYYKTMQERKAAVE